MNKFGFFDEQDEETVLPVLKQLESEGPLPNESQVLSYLAQGTQVLAIGGIALDLLSKDEKVIGSPHVFSDGSWCWTSDVAYYIETYHISLPPSLLAHMRNNNWRCPSVQNPKSIVQQLWRS